MQDAVFLYALGLVTGAGVAWFLMNQRLTFSPDMRDIVRDATTQAAFIRAVSDVVDEETNREIEQRANEVLDEYEIPGDPEWRYDP